MTHDHEHDSGFDAHMMDVALKMAYRGLGRAWPNPSVGALIADEASQQIIARGFTGTGGRPHAEIQALKAAGKQARGKTLYVTLEPCSHFGKTPPCVEAIIKAGISRVVVAGGDPDPRVAGRGLSTLKKAGVKVTTGLRHKEAHHVTLGHILRVTERRPFTQLKLALDAVGKIARGDGENPVWVTGPVARAFGHLMRARTDAILIGSGTLNDDDPELTCRLSGMDDRSPVRVIICDRQNMRKQSKLFKSAIQSPVWLACGLRGTDSGDKNPNPGSLATNEPSVEKQPRGQEGGLGTQVIEVPVVAGRLWLPALLESLVERGITRLMVEGGPTLWRAFAKAGLVDEVVAFIANRALQQSGSGITKKPVEMSDQQAMALMKAHLPGLRLSLTDKRSLGNDRLLRFHVK